MSKPLNLLNKNVETTVERFACRSKVKLLGSNSIRGFLYPSDVDIEVLAENITAKELSQRIQTAVKNLGDTIFSEFKTEDGSKKLRWTVKDILKGYKGKVTLAEALTKKGVIKLDLIEPVGDSFAEVSLYYIVSINGKSNVPELAGDDLIKSLKKDIKEYNSQNVLKALKRYYSIQKLKGKPSQAITDFLNSEVGLVSKCRGDLELMLLLIKHVSFSRIQGFLQNIKQSLGNTTVNEEWLTMDDWKAKSLKKQVKQLSDRLLEWTNTETKAFLKQQKIKI
jgi:hypothetical protein